jgi:hypothetical protein
MPLLYEKSSGYPFFMQSPAWSNKELLAALASWAELRHDTILYAKQSQTGWTGEPPPPQMAKSYVEPNPWLYARLYSLVQFTLDGLSQQNLLTERNAQKLRSYMDLLDMLLSVSIKELQNEALSTQEYNSIFSFGGTMESLINFRENPAADDSTEADDMAVVADVHTDPNTMTCLEEGVGYPLDLYAIVYDNGALRMTKGAIFSYYEFTQPIANRMTDEQWRSQLAAFSEPGLPQWTATIMDSSQKRKVLLDESPQNYFTAIDDENPVIAREFSLNQNYPNPFNSNTTIKYYLEKKEQVSIIIYNVLGQEVRTFINIGDEVGYNSSTWNGLDNYYRPVSSGIYIYKIIAGGLAKERKMLLIK